MSHQKYDRMAYRQSGSDGHASAPQFARHAIRQLHAQQFYMRISRTPTMTSLRRRIMDGYGYGYQSTQVKHFVHA